MIETQYRDHNFLGVTKSLCPECLALVDAKIVSRNNRVYFRKRCSKHGVREDFVCSDVAWFDRNEYSLPGKLPTSYGIQPSRGCPYDCGLCTEHEQHSCIGLLEITSHCNLECPICFAGSGPGGDHLTLQQCKTAIDRFVTVETQPEVLQLSGGEPTIHPEFLDVLDYACDQPIDIVMINTNGIRIARDPAFVEAIAKLRHRCEIYLQFDSFEDIPTEELRGASLVETKLKAIEKLGQHGIRTTLVCTVQAGLNEHQIGRLTDFAIQRPWITGLSFQPTTYTGRYFLPQDLEQRITFPDILKQLEEQTCGRWKTTDFSPLPCAHPNAHTLAYAFRDRGSSQTGTNPDIEFLPLARFINLEDHLELLAGRITFDRERAKSLIGSYLESLGLGGCGPSGCKPDEIAGLFRGLVSAETSELAQAFLTRAMVQKLDPEDLLRVTTTSFMDAYNFDVRQLMKSCVHHILPSGHLIPFSAYNVLYRNGHVELPDLGNQTATRSGPAEKLVSIRPT